jgi:hypothetical protein
LDEHGQAIGDTASVIAHAKNMFEPHWSHLLVMLSSWISDLLCDVSNAANNMNTRYRTLVNDLATNGVEVAHSLPKVLALARTLYDELAENLEALCLSFDKKMTDLPTLISNFVEEVLTKDTSYFHLRRFPNFIQEIAAVVTNNIQENMEFDALKDAIKRNVIAPLRTNPYPELSDFPKQFPRVLFPATVVTQLFCMSHVHLTCKQDIQQTILSAIDAAGGVPNAFEDTTVLSYKRIRNTLTRCERLYRLMTYEGWNTEKKAFLKDLHTAIIRVKENHEAELAEFEKDPSRQIPASAEHAKSWYTSLTPAQKDIFVKMYGEYLERTAKSPDEKAQEQEQFKEAPCSMLQNLETMEQDQFKEAHLEWSFMLSDAGMGLPAETSALFNDMVIKAIDSTKPEQREGATSRNGTQIEFFKEFDIPQLIGPAPADGVALFPIEDRIYHILMYIGMLASRLTMVDLSQLHLERTTEPVASAIVHAKSSLIIWSILEASAQDPQKPVVKLTAGTVDALRAHDRWSEFSSACNIQTT